MKRSTVMAIADGVVALLAELPRCLACVARGVATPGVGVVAHRTTSDTRLCVDCARKADPELVFHEPLPFAGIVLALARVLNGHGAQMIRVVVLQP